MKRLLYALLTALVLIFIAPRSHGALPEGADLSLAPWFNGLQQPNTGMSCCSIADCRPVNTRVGPQGWEIEVAGEWRQVPQEVILRGKENPTGRPVACVFNGAILCFVEPAGV